MRRSDYFSFLVVCLIVITLVGASQVAARVTLVSETVTPDVQCANGLMGRGKCPEGHELRGSAGDPVIAFSDLLSAPRSGWSVAESNKGAAVSIWGRNFGSTRGNNYVTVGGVSLTASTDYVETWGETGAPVNKLQRIVFHLNSSIPLGMQTISVTVGGKTSNAVSINVTENDIFFLDSAATGANEGTFENPWNDVGSFKAAMGPGDVAYIRGTWNTPQTTSDHIIYFNAATTDGTAANPISMVGWPEQTNLIETWSLTNNSMTCIVSYVDHLTISNLNFQCRTSAINASGGTPGVRAIGNRIGGMSNTPSGTGSITLKDDSSEALGNYLYGATSNNKLDHAIYLNGCMPNVGAVVAHNEIVDFDVAEGPLIVVNHQEDRCPSNVRLASHYIHSNLVDCTDHPSRGIGIYTQSWDSATDTAGQPEPTFVYNNVVNNCGMNGSPAMYQNSAHVEWYNNAVLNASYRGLSVHHAERAVSTTIKNNIFTMISGDPVYFGTIPTRDISTNIYFGGDAPPAEDAQAINSDPECVVNVASADIDCGTATHNVGLTLPEVISDYYLDPRSTDYDLGVREEIQ